MLDYKELSLNPYHLNRNQNTNDPGPQPTPNYADWTDLLPMGMGTAMDWFGLKGPSEKALTHSINPLEEAYKNLLDMSKQYKDPGSELNVQQRNVIRNRNLEATTDIMRRAANEAQGTVDDSVSTKGINSIAVQTAIANALENYNQAHGDRLKIAADYDTKAAAAANTLATARQQNLMYEQMMREKQAKAGTEQIDSYLKWFRETDPSFQSNPFGYIGDTIKGWFD